MDGGAILGGISDGARERDTRLQAMGIIRAYDGRYIQAASQLDGSPGFARAARGRARTIWRKFSAELVHLRARETPTSIQCVLDNGI